MGRASERAAGQAQRSSSAAFTSTPHSSRRAMTDNGRNVASEAGETSRFPQTPSTGPLRGRELQSATDRRGFTLWFTGLSGSGKTTIAELVRPELERRGLLVEWLDGDEVREHLSKGLGFSKEDRDTNIDRIGWVASRLTRHGAAVIVQTLEERGLLPAEVTA